MDEVHGVKGEQVPEHRGSELAYALASIGENIVAVGTYARRHSSICWARW